MEDRGISEYDSSSEESIDTKNTKNILTKEEMVKHINEIINGSNEEQLKKLLLTMKE